MMVGTFGLVLLAVGVVLLLFANDSEKGGDLVLSDFLYAASPACMVLAVGLIGTQAFGVLVGLTIFAVLAGIMGAVVYFMFIRKGKLPSP